MKRLALLLLPLAVGCADVSGYIRRQASMDHNCPLEKVVYVGERQKNPWTEEVEVCGKKRIYRNMPSEQNNVNFVDITNTFL